MKKEDGEAPFSDYLESPLAALKRQWNIEELRKVAKARGMKVETLVAQMLEQVLRQEKPQNPAS